MGDRANIFLVDQRRDDLVHGIYLYTHWNGYRWPEALRDGLEEARSRWGDEPYSARIIIQKVFADIDGSATGGGVSTFLCDNAYPILVCDLVNLTVSYAKEGDEDDPLRWYGTTSFADFCKLEQPDYRLASR